MAAIVKPTHVVRRLENSIVNLSGVQQLRSRLNHAGMTDFGDEINLTQQPLGN